MGSNPISSAQGPFRLEGALLRHTVYRQSPSLEAPSVPRYYVKVDVEVEADDKRLVTVELQGRLLDNTTRPPGLRVENALVIAIHEQPEPE